MISSAFLWIYLPYYHGCKLLFIRSRVTFCFITGEVNTNDNAPMSSFELAMVRNKGGSAQRLINSDTESRSGKSVASKKSRTTVDRYDSFEWDLSISNLS